MRKKNVYEPYIGQVWTSPQADRFVIKDLLVQEDDAWVSYYNDNTKQEYRCRLEAFKHRFHPQAD